MSPRAPSRPGDFTGRQPQAVLSALAVLEEVARAGPGITAQEIATNLGLSRATSYRLLNLLVQDEYLVRLPDLAGFALGRKVALLSGMAAQQDSDREIGVILAQMRSRIRGGVHLADLSAGRVEFLDVDADFPLSDAARIADALEDSAFGRLILAERDLRAGAGPVPYAVQVGVLVPGFGCFVAAVRDETGRLLAGVGLALPAARLAEPTALLETVAEDVRRLAELLAPAR
ncbi:MAG: helix-turn-helix domain-containing protein [Nocardioides sp.]|uniref:helix-turn-helix domain-containing protein n=1 Tax=Nocardioides sp. TaxID=35761 RepID=UPI0039E3AAAD